MTVGLVVHLDIESDHLDEFLDIVRKHGRFSVDNEPGCLSFNVLRSTEAVGKVILVETYADQAALDSHWASEHMQAYRERTGSMIRSRERHLAEVL